MRWLAPGLAAATLLGAFAILQGMLTAGLVPLAVFGPAYALARSLDDHGGRARRQAARVTVAASAAIGLAFLPALAPAGLPAPSWSTLGAALTAAGAGTLAGFAAADHTAPSRQRQRWSFIHAMQARHARGLAVLAGVATLAGTLVALLREAPIARLGETARTLPEAVFGELAVAGALVLPDPTASFAIAFPLSLAPLAIGFLTSPERSAPFAAGGAAIALLAPLVVWLDVPVRAATGAWVPVSVLDEPGLAVVDALAPSATGLLVAAGLVYAIRHHAIDCRATRAGWALVAALVTAIVWGLVPALTVALGIAAAALLAYLATDRAPFGLAITLGALLGGLTQFAFPLPTSWTMGALAGAAAGAAAGTHAATRSIEVPDGELRSPTTLTALLLALVGLGLLVVLAGDIAPALGPFPAPHARGLEAGLAALIEGEGALLLAWGLVAGAVVEATTGQGAWVGLGALAGPGIAVLVLAGSLLRALWEKGLLDRAREGYVMRGQLGYELVRVHVLVAGVLAGETIAMAIAAAIG